MYKGVTLSKPHGAWPDTIHIIRFFKAMLNTNSTEQKFPYKEAVLKDRNGSLDKKWYITFRVWHKQKNKLVQKYDYEINKFPDPSDRRRFARKYIRQMNAMLADGFIIDESNLEPEKLKVIYLKDGFHDILEIKRNEYSHGTYVSYSQRVEMLLTWLKDNHKEFLPANELTQSMVLDFLDHMAKKGTAPRTLNNYRDGLKSIFNEIKDRHQDILKENPFSGIKKRKEVASTRNVAYKGSEKRVLIELIKHIEPELFQFIQFIYYCFLRPNEIRQLQVYNVQLATGKIFIEAFKSKSKRNDYIIIPPSFIPTLQELIKDKPSNAYLFPGQKVPCISKNIMSDRHRAIIKRFDWVNGHTLYSWKHTGVVDAYNNGVDIKSLQLQLRHYSLEDTDTYLKSLGMFSNDAILTKMPTLI